MATKGISAFLGKSIDNIGDLTQGIRNSGVNLKAVRVTGILLNDKNPRFEELGGWNGLGTIEYQEIDNPIVFSKYPTAKPLISNSKQFPLINEIYI